MPRVREEGDQDAVDTGSPFAGEDGRVPADPADAPVAKGEHCPPAGKFPHGSRAGYKRGCRGLECTKANTESKRGQRQRSSGRSAGTSGTPPAGAPDDTSLVPALADILELAGGGLAKVDPLPGAVLAQQARPEAATLAPWVAKNPALKRGVLAFHRLLTGGEGGGAWLPFVAAIALSRGLVDPETLFGVGARKMVDATGVQDVDAMLEYAAAKREERQAQVEHDADAVYLDDDADAPNGGAPAGWRPGGLLRQLAGRGAPGG